MRVRMADADDVAEVVHAMRGMDAREVLAVSFADEVASIAAAMCATMDRRTDICIADDQGHAIAIIGGSVISPRVASVHMIATDRWGEVARPATRWLVREIFPRLVLPHYNRLECRASEAHTVARSWLERLGFALEGIHPAFGRNGETYCTYAWINPAPRFER